MQLMALDLGSCGMHCLVRAEIKARLASVVVRVVCRTSSLAACGSVVVFHTRLLVQWLCPQL